MIPRLEVYLYFERQTEDERFQLIKLLQWRFVSIQMHGLLNVIFSRMKLLCILTSKHVIFA